MKKSYLILSLVLTLVLVLSCSTAMAISVSAEAQTDAPVEETAQAPLRDIKGGDLNIMDRISYAVQGTATGMLMIFAVLSLLAIIVSLSKYIFAGNTNKKEKTSTRPEPTPKPAPKAPVTPAAPKAAAMSNDELIAVITAAVAATIESDASGELQSRFASGFRVVSFTRTTKSGAWNKN